MTTTRRLKVVATVAWPRGKGIHHGSIMVGPFLHTMDVSTLYHKHHVVSYVLIPRRNVSASSDQTLSGGANGTVASWVKRTERYIAYPRMQVVYYGLMPAVSITMVPWYTTIIIVGVGSTHQSQRRDVYSLQFMVPTHPINTIGMVRQHQQRPMVQSFLFLIMSTLCYVSNHHPNRHTLISSLLLLILTKEQHCHHPSGKNQSCTS